ncbi:adenine-specific methyltransferase EcoRI family protein [Kangiella aquimarina]|uniref:Adenine-specific methyltransferase EcoRI family protein n=1 Tax=Kangiella aquimarina TaxID=261965 RepID=A0ABZ0X774_9GAMM|nr:adenine-specific methyltransferase EcoRI family protein [Kangiella aquimarina]WQG86199.1 adenine-specific methyltransferase EcoRI family protein [Kangiella aquimarina]
MAKRAQNKKLAEAKKNKKDEFYTQLSDIERELKHYRKHFKGKVVYCNCDDPRISNFFHYFSYNFEKLGLKKLITTCYKSQNMDLFSRNESEKAIMLEYNGDKNRNNIPDVDEIGVHQLKGDGDFRSEECIKILKQADIVVTNPPFSLFREYVSQLIEHDKKFIIVGHQNAIKYKEIFPLIRDNRLWLGFGFKGGAAHFINKHYEDYATATDRKEGMIRVSGVHWFTNLDINKRHEDLILYKKYTPKEYPKYENFDAINVDKTKEIPYDYAGMMGVPITFMDKYNPDQFEIIGVGIANAGLEIGVLPYKPEHKKYRKEVQKRGAVDGDLYMIVNGEVTVPYTRIIIKNKKI